MITTAILTLLLAGPVSASETLLPYIPTRILIPTGDTDNTDTAYIFAPNDAGDSVELVAVNVSSTLDGSSINAAAKTLTSRTPFLPSDDTTTTFTPTIAADGSLVVYAGDCASTDSSVWVYNTSSSADPSWDKNSLSAPGPNFLGGGVAFSEVLAPVPSIPQIYIYGGQCPNVTLNGTTWIDGSDYSNTMIRLTDYGKADTLSLKNQPIAEAGFSFTTLPPSTSNTSGTVTQNVNSVVLGGHTQTAFVNMSTAAVWALPEDSWSFISISSPSSSSPSDPTELAKHAERAVTEVQPRSGHTAVLNEEGTALIVLGGWVGDPEQAATPQVAVLEMSGVEFGEWSWSVPDFQPLADGEGIYGHGAALLPGNVMMVVGGYSISSSSSRRGRRDDIGVAGGKLNMFLNLTSMTWSDAYTNPSAAASSSSAHKSSGSLSTLDKLGIGLGVGLGVPLLLILLSVLWCCWRRRQRRRHSTRDTHVRNLTSGGAFITSEEMLQAGHENEYTWGPRAAARWYASYTGGHDPYLRDDRSLGYESLRGQSRDMAPQHAGLDDHMASEALSGGGTYRSTRRKPVPRVAKGMYQPTGMDESRAFGVISPILEDEEDELSMHGAKAMSPDQDFEGEGREDDVNDPFMTPTISTPSPTKDRFAGLDARNTILFVAPSPSPDPPSPGSPTRSPSKPIQPQHPEVQDWVLDIDASDAVITRRLQPHGTTLRSSGMGSLSPTRRLSVRSPEDEPMSPGAGARTNSNLSESNRSAFSFMPGRSDSLRVAATMPAMLAMNPDKRGGTSHSDNSTSSNTNSSYTTAKSIPMLQQEGPPLLLGRPRPISDIEDVADVSDDEAPGSPSKNKPPRRSWFGSLRRVFSGGHSSSSSAGGGSSRTESPARGDSNDWSTMGLGGVGMLHKRRQGRLAWADQQGQGEAAGGFGASASRAGAGEGWDEEDWDIERAVEQRLVQVMFSVPKERLRIVNGEPDIISIGESVVVVDPEKEGCNDDEEEEEADELSAFHEEEKKMLIEGKGKGVAEGKQTSAESANSAQLRHDLSDNLDQQRVYEAEMRGRGEQDEGEKLRPQNQQQQPEDQPLLLEVPQRTFSDASKSTKRSFSPGVPMTAEEVRFERPRTRVLDMVESFEQRSRSNSPVKEELPFTWSAGGSR